MELYVGRAGESVDDGRRYDVVTFCNVLDQLRMPREALIGARRLLNPGGCVAIRVPNGVFHHAFRAVGNEELFYGGTPPLEYSNRRLIARSAWNPSSCWAMW